MQGGRGAGGNIMDDDGFILLVIGIIAAGAVAGSIGLYWSKCVEWMLEHDLVVPASAAPIVALPSAGGVGLDVARVAVVAGVALLTLVGAIGLGRRAIRRGPVS